MIRSEEQCDPKERFLFADEYFSDEAIAIWKAECIKRCANKTQDIPYGQFINWKRKENEIAVFTLYAYADFKIPKTFNIIFRLDDPDQFIEMDYELTQSIYEAWMPLDTIVNGHKHLCIFRFENELPEILKNLQEGTSKFSNAPKGQRKLGFCQATDFEEIRTGLKKAYV